MSSIFFISFGIYVAALLALSLVVGRKESEDDFLIAGRSRSWFQVGMSKYAASIGAGWFIAYSGFAYEYGLPVFLIFGGATIGMLLYAFWAVPKILSNVDGTTYTLGDYVRHKTQSVRAVQLVNISAVSMLLLNLLIAVVGGAALLNTFGVFTYETAVMVMVATILSYMVLSGFKAVMLTDLIQGGLLLLLLPLVGYGVWQAHPAELHNLLDVRDVSLLGMAMLSVFGVVSVFADPTRFQVTYAGKDVAAVKRGMLFSVGPMWLTGLIIFIMSSVVYTLNANLEAAAVFPTALQTYVPTMLVPFGFLAFFIAVMSTADSNLYALAAHTTNFLKQDRPTKAIMRWLLVFYGIALILLALLFRDVVDVAVLTGAILIVVAVPLIYLIAGGTNRLRFIALLITGWVGMLLGVVFIGLKPDAAIFVLLGFLVASLLPSTLLRRLA